MKRNGYNTGKDPHSTTRLTAKQIYKGRGWNRTRSNPTLCPKQKRKYKKHNAMTTLTTGVYELPPDCKGLIRGGKVYVSPRMRCEERIPRCRDCKHFALGQSKYNQHYPSPVCLLQPKENGDTGYTENVRSQKRYYSVRPCDMRCDKYEPNNQ